MWSLEDAGFCRNEDNKLILLVLVRMYQRWLRPPCFFPFYEKNLNVWRMIPVGYRDRNWHFINASESNCRWLGGLAVDSGSFHGGVRRVCGFSAACGLDTSSILSATFAATMVSLCGVLSVFRFPAHTHTHTQEDGASQFVAVGDISSSEVEFDELWCDCRCAIPLTLHHFPSPFFLSAPKVPVNAALTLQQERTLPWTLTNQ